MRYSFGERSELRGCIVLGVIFNRRELDWSNFISDMSSIG